MRAVINNRSTSIYASTEQTAELKQYFRYQPQGYRFSPQYKHGMWDGFISMFKWGKVPTGLFLAHQTALEAKYGKFEIEDEREQVKFKPYPKSAPVDKARPFQLECVDSMIANSTTGGLVICATGSGKTFTAALYFSRLDGSACFCVDELTLLVQAQEEIAAVTGEKVGIVGMGVFEPRRLTVATIQTLNKHASKPEFEAWFKKLHVLLLDEFHVALNSRSIGVVEKVRPLAVFGLTATLQLEKTDVAMRAYALAGPVCYRYTLKQGQDEGILSQGRTVCLRYVYTAPSISYRIKYDRFIVENMERNSIVQQVAEQAVKRGHRVLVLVRRHLHLATLDKLLEHIPHRTLSGVQKTAERRGAIKNMERGKVPLLLVTSIFTKGVNIKSVDVLINAAADSNSNSVQQKLGRLARVFAGKTFLYIDISDCAPANGINVMARASTNRREALKALGLDPKVVKWTGPSSLDEVFTNDKICKASA